MIAHVLPHPLSGRVAAVKSKSYAHRLLIAAALSGGRVAFGDSDDARYTARALEALGFTATFDGDSVAYGAFRPSDEVKRIEVGESGSTLRFLLPLAAALGVQADLVTAGRLGERPMGALTETLSGHGVTATAHSVRGRLASGVYEIDATISSQFVTGLLLALPLLAGDSEIRLLGRAVSAPYIDITLEVLAQAGVEIVKTPTGFLVPGGQTYRLTDAVVPGDFSGAAFPLVAGALGDGVTLTGLSLLSAQGDKAVLDVIRLAGGVVTVSEEGITAKKGALRAFRVNVGETPDLAPILSVLAAYATGESVLDGVARLRDKESDRLAAIEEMLAAAGIASREEGDSLVIAGGVPTGGVFDSRSDHRMAMSAAILAAFAKGESRVSDMTCVKKSYPGFWEDFAGLGGRYAVER